MAFVVEVIVVVVILVQITGVFKFHHLHTAMAVRLSENRYAALAGDGSHLADDSMVAIGFYNVGIQNEEIHSVKWYKSKTRL